MMAKLGNAAAIAGAIRNGSPLEAPHATPTPAPTKPRKPKKQEPSYRISLTLTSKRRRNLRALADEASDELGRIVSGSEILLTMLDAANDQTAWADILGRLERSS